LWKHGPALLIDELNVQSFRRLLDKQAFRQFMNLRKFAPRLAERSCRNGKLTRTLYVGPFDIMGVRFRPLLTLHVMALGGEVAIRFLGDRGDGTDVIANR